MIALFLRLKFFWGIRRYGAKLGRLFLDRRVSPSLKMMTAVGALLVISPVDLLSDIPIIGAFDDVALLALLAMMFVRFCPPDVVAEYFDRTGGPRIKNVTPHVAADL